MKKVFLIGFSSPILIEVAKNLRNIGVEIVYWQGYRDDFDELSRSKVGFETTIFRHNYDANKNITPIEVDDSEFEPVSKDIIENMFPYGWHILSMISRTDYMNTTFVKRRSLYYGYIKFWHGMIKKYEPDAIIFNAIPHLALGFTLYGIAKILKVKTLILERIVGVGNSAMLMFDYKSGFKKVFYAYERTRKNTYTLDDLSEDLRSYFVKQKSNQLAGIPKESEYAHLKTYNNKMPFRTPSMRSILRNLLQFTFLKTSKSYLAMLFLKRKTNYYDKDFTGLRMTIMSRRLGRIGKVRQKEYVRLEIQPDYSKKYVYIPLSFQPEHTTLPMGDVYDDQLLMIDMVASVLPKGWVLYVKEHLPQWYPHHTQTHAYRYKGYYEQIMSKKNVYLVPATTNPRKLIQNSQAVATITGTTGWEALINSKPALVFGYVWYRYCNGIFRITDQETCKKAIQKIEKGVIITELHLIQYLKALDEVSIKVDNYKTRSFAENAQISKQENISTITQSLYEHLVNNK